MQIDDQIVQKNKQIEEIQQAIKRQRLRYIDELSKNDPPDAENYKGDFAIQLKRDIEQDIDISSERLEELQKAVETAKVMSLCTGNLPHSQEVEVKRQERNIGFTEHQKLLHARENLRELMTETGERRMSLTESIRHSFRSKKGRIVTNPLQDIYLEMHSKIRHIKEDTIELVDKKVMMISVKEAVRNTLEEIKESNESQGLDTDRRGGTRATHVLRQSRIPREWLTLTEQVAVTLADTGNEITQRHITFTDRVTSQCSAAMFEKHLLDLSSDKNDDTEGGNDSSEKEIKLDRESKKTNSTHSSHSTFYDFTTDSELGNVIEFDKPEDALTKDEQLALELHKDLNRNSLISLEGEIGTEDIVIVHDTEEDHLKRLVDTLKVDIHSHFEEIVKLFQAELKISNPTSYKKLWLCYEAHFYDAVMEHLVKVYEYTYSHISNKLTQCIPELSADDLNLEDTVVAGLLESTTSRKSLQHVQFSENPPPAGHEEEEEATGATTVTNIDGPTNDAVENEESHKSEQEQDDSKNRESENSEQDQDGDEFLTEKEELLRQLGAPHPVTDTPSDHHVKKVTIHYPSSVTMIYNRRTWPLPTLQTLTAEFECGMDALMLDGDDSLSDDELEQIAEQQTATQRRSNSGVDKDSPSSGVSPAKKMRIRAKYRHRFVPALNSIHEALQDSVPLVKLQHLTRCLREIVQSISNLQTEEFQMPMGVCCDNLLDMLVVLLCNCNTQTVAQLHAHVMMLTDLMPPCLMNGPYEYSLLQFFGAFQIIQERVVVKSRNQGGHKNTFEQK